MCCRPLWCTLTCRGSTGCFYSARSARNVVTMPVLLCHFGAWRVHGFRAKRFPLERTLGGANGTSAFGQKRRWAHVQAISARKAVTISAFLESAPPRGAILRVI